MISSMSWRDMYNGTPALATPKMASSQEIKQGESNNSWRS